MNEGFVLKLGFGKYWTRGKENGRTRANGSGHETRRGLDQRDLRDRHGGLPHWILDRELKNLRLFIQIVWFKIG